MRRWREGIVLTMGVSKKKEEKHNNNQRVKLR
jgi:hypothetical protein